MSLLPKSYHADADGLASAQHVSLLLGGHALGISQVAAFISAKSISISSFTALYKNSPSRVHRVRRDGWAFHGYSHALDTVWKMSFEALPENGKNLLALLCFLAPEEIPQQLLQPGTLTFPEEFSFLTDEFE
jgi:hypothetical protein